MRISDWSSDVCSSDLVEGELSQNPLLDHDEGDGSAVLESVDRDNLLRHETAGGPEPVRSTAERAATETLPAAADDPNDGYYDHNWSSTGTDEPVGGAAMVPGCGRLAGRRSHGAGGGEGDQYGSAKKTEEN